MKSEPITQFDRVAIAFGAALLGYGAGLAAAITLTLEMLLDASGQTAGIWKLLYYKIPVLFGLFSGFAGFFFPVAWANGLGEIWKFVIGRWLH